MVLFIVCLVELLLLPAFATSVFFLITLPIIAPALVSGWLLAFTLSLDDVVLASFLSGPASTTLPVALFSMLRLGMTPKVNALAVLILAAAGLALLLAAGLTRARVARGRGGD